MKRQLKIVNGEISYLSDADDQSYGAWCPVGYDCYHRFKEGETLVVGEELEAKIKELEQEVASLEEGQSSFLALLEILPYLDEPMLFLSYWTEGNWEACHDWDEDINEIKPDLFKPLFEAEQPPEVK